MRIWLNDANENWIVDRLKEEFIDHNKSIVTNDPYKADIIWVIADWVYWKIPSQLLSNKKVITTIHHINPDKFDPEDIKIKDTFTDLYHCTNEITATFLRKHTTKKITTIPFWYDSKKWFSRDKQLARKKLNLSENAFIIGSFQRDTEGKDLVSPKLEKGPDRFCEYVSRYKSQSHTNQELIVLLGGNRRQYVKKMLDKENIKYIYIENAPLETLYHMYASLDMYVVASRTEGGPQAIIECSAMMVPIISSNVGLAPYILCDNNIIDFDNTTLDVIFPTDKDIEYNRNKAYDYCIEQLSYNYYNMLRSV